MTTKSERQFMVQIGGTEPNKWKWFNAIDAYEAIAMALRGIISSENGIRPSVAYVAKGPARHSNGAPMYVQSYSLTY